MPDLPFKIAGAGPLADTELKRAPPNVEWVGMLKPPELETFYRGARMWWCRVSPTKPLPMVALESLSNGVPVIGSSVGAIPETLDNGRAGLLVPPGEIEPLIAAISSLWGDPELCRRFGAAGRDAVTRRHSNSRHFDLLCSAYRQGSEALRNLASCRPMPRASSGR